MKKRRKRVEWLIRGLKLYFCFSILWNVKSIINTSSFENNDRYLTPEVVVVFKSLLSIEHNVILVNLKCHFYVMNVWDREEEEEDEAKVMLTRGFVNYKLLLIVILCVNTNCYWCFCSLFFSSREQKNLTFALQNAFDDELRQEEEEDERRKSRGDRYNLFESHYAILTRGSLGQCHDKSAGVRRVFWIRGFLDMRVRNKMQVVLIRELSVNLFCL